jgi:hypothetical protein
MKHLLRFAALALVLGLMAAVAYGTMATLKIASPADWKYKGITYVSWTKDEYPVTTSWLAQTYPDSQAIKAVSITTECAHSGVGGLQMEVDLVGGHPNKSNGEVFVDLRYRPPLLEPPCCLAVPVDLDKVRVCAHVWCPIGSAGTPSMPNGLQVFVKDEVWRSFYGDWQNIHEGEWNQVCVTPGTAAPPGGYMEPGFDPTSIVLLGVKVGAGGGSTATFSGTMCLDDVGWNRDGCAPSYPFENVESALDQIRDIRANYVSLVDTWYMDAYTSSAIYPDPEKTHTEAEIVDTIQAIHDRGMGVLLKPHVDVKDGTWRGAIDPADKDAWFTSYTAFISHYAEIAQDHGVELLSAGTELESMVAASYRPRWIAMTDAIRQTYAGPLTYAANWDGYQDVSFWDRVDLAGIDAYFPLSNDPDPSLDDLVNGWTTFCYTATSPCGTFGEPGECHNWVDEIKSWQATIDKPVIFTEIGYQSADCAAAAPWAAPSTTPNCGLQARCYAAAFDVFGDEPWFQGVFWWAWDPWSDAGGCCDPGFTPQNKPAESVVRGSYRRALYLPLVLKDY